MSLYIRNEQLIRADGFTAELISGSTATGDAIASAAAAGCSAAISAGLSSSAASQSITAAVVAVNAAAVAADVQHEPGQLTVQDAALPPL